MIMKSLIEYIFEHRTKDEVKIYFGDREINPSIYIYDKDSLDDLIQKYKSDLIDNSKELRLCHLNKNWKVLKNICIMDIGRLTDNFIKFGTKFFSYQDIIDKLESGNYILIMI